MVAAGLMIFGCGVAETGTTAVAQRALKSSTPDTPPLGHAETVTNESQSKGKKQGSEIVFHGGAVMLGTPNIYYIWYGDWAGNTAPEILEHFARNVGGSPYYNINTTYTDAAGTPLSNAATFAGSIEDPYSQGTRLSDAQIQQVVATAVGSGQLPKDENGVYFVLTSADVTAQSGFCTQYCGWHTHASIDGSDLKYAFVGNPERCPESCAEQTVGPNGNAGADAMVNIVAHEFEEATSDPDLDAWYDRRGYENADKCAWTFGYMYPAANGALANMKLGGRDYLIQQNWANARGGYCAKAY
jgi:hypothetical protein